MSYTAVVMGNTAQIISLYYILYIMIFSQHITTFKTVSSESLLFNDYKNAINCQITYLLSNSIVIKSCHVTLVRKFTVPVIFQKISCYSSQYE